MQIEVHLFSISADIFLIGGKRTFCLSNALLLVVCNFPSSPRSSYTISLITLCFKRYGPTIITLLVIVVALFGRFENTDKHYAQFLPEKVDLSSWKIAPNLLSISRPRRQLTSRLTIVNPWVWTIGVIETLSLVQAGFQHQDENRAVEVATCKRPKVR